MGGVGFLFFINIFMLILQAVSASKHFELLEDGKKFTWHEAYQLCLSKSGNLVNGTHMSKLPHDVQEKHVLLTMLNVSDTWTSLNLINGHFQEIPEYTSSSQVSNEPWKQNSKVGNMCVKISARNELEAVQCITQLPVVCEFQGLYREGDTFQLGERKSFMTTGSNAISVNNLNAYAEDHHLLTKSQRGNQLSRVHIDHLSSSLSRPKRQSVKMCPPNFILNTKYMFCVRETKPNTWSVAYQDCFRNGIEKTPLDIGGYASNIVGLLKELLDHSNDKTIWLAVQRKKRGGPFIHSGPVQSNLDYSDFNAVNQFNINWNKENSNANHDCMILNMINMTLETKPCDSNFPFICLFPSVFWVKNFTYDSYCRRDKLGGSCTSSLPMTWEDAREQCRRSDNSDLIDEENVRNKAEKGYYYVGQQNTKLDNTSTTEITDWLQYNTTNPLFLRFTVGFSLTNYANKGFICVQGAKQNQTKLVMIIEDSTKWNGLTVGTPNILELSRLYGIRCFLNNKLIRNVTKPHFVVHRQGYVFCEALSHSPVQIIKSDSILVQNPDVLTFSCEIFVQGVKYDFALHDLTFNSNDTGSVSYYEKLLNQELNGYNVTIVNVTASKANGIDIAFHIEAPIREEQFDEGFRKVSLLLKRLKNKSMTVNYFRSTKYCMPDKLNFSSGSNCRNNYTSHMTHIGATDSCIQCNKIISCACIGDYATGAQWGTVDVNDLPELSPFENTCNITESNIRNTFTNMASTSLERNNPDKSAVTDFIRTFEDRYFGKEVNETTQLENTSVTIFSTSNFRGVKGFYLRQHEEFKAIGHEDDIDIVKINATAALYLNYSNNSILISHFLNAPAFPIKSNGYKRITPVFLVNVSSVQDIAFPIQIIISLTHEKEINASTSISCGFWNETTNQWEAAKSDLNEGQIADGLFNCTYYHLTSFTVLVLGVDDMNIVLDWITKVGCSLSLLGLGLVLVIFLALHSWKKTRNILKLHFFLSLSLFCMYLSFLIGLPQTSNQTACIVFGIFLHYFTLASFCWMFVIAYDNYLKFVKIFNTYIPRFMWKACLFAWSIPAVPIIVICIVDHQLYRQKEVCWLHSRGFTYGFQLPACLIVLSNLIIYIRIFFNMFKRMGNFKDGAHAQQFQLIPQIILSLCLFVTFGLSWLFGILVAVRAGIIFSYFFCVFCTAQGFLVFIFFIRIEKTAKEVITKFLSSCPLICKINGEDVHPLSPL